MKVVCVHCGASGQMDEARIPAGVTSIRCPRCKQSFPIPEIAKAPGAEQPAEVFERPTDYSSSPQPLRTSVGPEAAGLNAPPIPPPIDSTPPPQSNAVPMLNCKVCSGQFPRNEMVRFGSALLCATCKPGYVQMLAQGTPRPADVRYAGFWIRLGAKILDWIILGVAYFFISMAVGMAIPKTSPKFILISAGVLYILQVAMGASYSGYFLGSFRATPGKMACGLAVVSPEGEQVSFMRGVGRYFAEILSGMVFMIGYLMMLFDDEKRALHDRICNTRVICN